MYLKNINISLSEPINEVITIDEAKSFLRVDDDGDNDLILQLIRAVREFAENYMNISIVAKQITLSFVEIKDNLITLPFSPVISINELKYYDIQNGSLIYEAEQSDYHLHHNNYSLYLKKYFPNSELFINYNSGISVNGDNNLVPAGIRYGMLAHLSKIYDSRGGNYSIPKSVQTFYDTYRIIKI